MCFARSATSVSSRHRSRSPSSSSKIAALLNLEKADERQTHDFLRRACSGRWPIWRLLGMRRQGLTLYVAVKWLRAGGDTPYSLVELSLDRTAMWMRAFPTAAAARAALAAVDVQSLPPTAPAAPAAIRGKAK